MSYYPFDVGNNPPFLKEVWRHNYNSETFTTNTSTVVRKLLNNITEIEIGNSYVKFTKYGNK